MLPAVFIINLSCYSQTHLDNSIQEDGYIPADRKPMDRNAMNRKKRRGARKAEEPDTASSVAVAMTCLLAIMILPYSHRQNGSHSVHAMGTAGREPRRGVIPVCFS